MSGLASAPPFPPAAAQWTALSGRAIRAGVREGDLVFGFLAPFIFFACFYVPLRHSMERVGVGADAYAQYLLPVIALQGMLFTAMSAADRAARDTASGMGWRLGAMPVRSWAAPAARMSANLLRAVTAVAGALVVGCLAGFRFHGGGAAVVFIALALAFALATSIGADALGAATGTEHIGTHALLAPQLLLVMTSTGFVPVEDFPGWIQPWVRHQPVSVAADGLRALADGRFTTTVGAALAWAAGLAVVFAALWGISERRRS